jgi:hypothetical protein
MKKHVTYEERLKKMKDSIEIKKVELLSEDDFPDDVTYLGSPKLVHMDEDEIDPCTSKEKANEQKKRSK